MTTTIPQDLEGYTQAVQEYLRGLAPQPNPAYWGIEDQTLAQQILNRERNNDTPRRTEDR